MSCNFSTSCLKKIDSMNFEIPSDAGDVVQITYSDGSIVPPDMYTFLPPRLVQFSCAVPIERLCLNVTYTEYEVNCDYNPCCK